MPKRIDIKDFKDNFNVKCDYVINTNLPLIITNNSKPFVVLLSFNAYDAIEKLFEIIDFIKLDNKKYTAFTKNDLLKNKK